MPRAYHFSLVPVAASMLALTLSSCGNSSTTHACEGTGACQDELSSKPAAGEDVKLYLAGFGQPIFGVVADVDDQSIGLQTRSGGRLVARWSCVVAWEAGVSVRAEQSQAEMVQQLMEYREETNDMIHKTSSLLPGAETE